MATVATVRGWYSIGSQYLYWDTTQIADPFSEYPGTYPAAATISDVVLSKYNYELATSYSPDTYVLWSAGVDDGYVVGIISTGGVPYCSLSTPQIFYGTCPKASGVSLTTNYVRTIGVCSVYCDSLAVPGNKMYVSTTNNGMVSRTMPLSKDNVVIPVGICLSSKLSTTPAIISMMINIEPPITLQQTITP